MIMKLIRIFLGSFLVVASLKFLLQSSREIALNFQFEDYAEALGMLLPPVLFLLIGLFLLYSGLRARPKK